jgi:hypothetical protein
MRLPAERDPAHGVRADATEHPGHLVQGQAVGDVITTYGQALSGFGQITAGAALEQAWS